jgi:hypothetical protein
VGIFLQAPKQKARAHVEGSRGISQSLSRVALSESDQPGECPVARAQVPGAGADRDSSHRVLRHLVSRGVFEEPERGRFALNETARGLLGESRRLGFDLEGIGGRIVYVWGMLLSAVRTGKPAYQEALGRGFGKTRTDVDRRLIVSAWSLQITSVKSASRQLDGKGPKRM